MVLIEKEARKKSCCLKFDKFCIVSECMAWRWLEGYMPFNSEEKLIKKGYCGLAGAP